MRRLGKAPGALAELRPAALIHQHATINTDQDIADALTRHIEAETTDPGDGPAALDPSA